MTDQEFEILLQLGHETHGVEFKGPGVRTNPAFLATVARAMLGMSNRRDGGLVIIGVDSDSSDSLDPIGLDEDGAKTWSYDETAAAVNEYSTPSMIFELERKIYNENVFIIIRISEFLEIPLLCRKDYHATNVKKASPTLRRGACYVRSRHKPETAEIPSEEEMRELLELAIDKGVRRFVERATQAGLFQAIQPAPSTRSDQDLFDDQLKDMT